jgi:hypothetical protein
MDVRETGRVDDKLIELAQERIHWRSLVNTLMRSRRRWEDDIKIYLKEIQCEDE